MFKQFTAASFAVCSLFDTTYAMGDGDNSLMNFMDSDKEEFPTTESYPKTPLRLHLWKTDDWEQDLDDELVFDMYLKKLGGGSDGTKYQFHGNCHFWGVKTADWKADTMPASCEWYFADWGAKDSKQWDGTRINFHYKG